MPITLANDRQGSVIRRKPGEWLVCFVPAVERQWWHPLLGSWMKHCFALKEENGKWLIFEPWWSRIMITVLTEREAKVFFFWARKGIILKVKEHVPGNSRQYRGWMSCAALISHILGRPYWVYTPYQLYKKLKKEKDTEIYS